MAGLVDKGNTVLVIEHNLDVIKTADWMVDMGPEGGNRGGLVVAEGTPEEVAAHPDSYTGQFLAPLLAHEEDYREEDGHEGDGHEGDARQAGHDSVPHDAAPSWSDSAVGGAHDSSSRSPQPFRLLLWSLRTALVTEADGSDHNPRESARPNSASGHRRGSGHQTVIRSSVTSQVSGDRAG